MTKSNSAAISPDCAGTPPGFLPPLQHSASSDPGSKFSCTRSESPTDSRASRPSGGSDSVKLPQLPDRSKSTSVSSLESWRRRTPRADICKSPSCPQLWDGDDGPPSSLELPSGHVSSRRSKKKASMLPCIFSNTPLVSDADDGGLMTPRYGVTSNNDILQYKNKKLTPRVRREPKRKATTNAVLLPLQLTPRQRKRGERLAIENSLNTRVSDATPEEETQKWEQHDQGQYYEDEEANDEEEEEPTPRPEENNRPLVNSDDRCREWLKDVARHSVSSSGEEGDDGDDEEDT